jgi:ComF family protein
MGSKFSAPIDWASFWKQGQEFVFKSPCPLCGRHADSFFCKDCDQKLAECRRPKFKAEASDLPPLYCWGRYEGVLKQSLAKLKYDRQHRVAVPLGNRLAELWQPLQQSQSNRFWIGIPIPLHSERQRQRGYNQADLIAQSLCKTVGMPLRSQGLIRSRSTTAQHGLSRSARHQNLQSAFGPGPDLLSLPPEASVILIDDIFTTGATLRAAVSTLQESGIHVAALFAVAASERDRS